jgi:Tfp pilus assembly protein PilV
MAIHFRPTPLLAMIGVLALAGASAARAQDTSAAVRSDTSGYQPYQNRTDSTKAGQDSSRTDSSGFKYTGPPTDTALKAAPGAQTGPTGTDSGSAAAPSGMSASDSVVCKDGSTALNQGGIACGAHGGVDSVVTTTAMKARGWLGKSDSSAAEDSSVAKDTAASSQRESP